ncbi:hypothetical protein [Enterocloster citroniae]
MRKKILFITVACITLTACSSGIPQDQYESVSSAASIAESEKESALSELSSVSASLDSLKAEYSNYKESMEQYEGLSEAEATAKKIEAESKAAAESAAMEESVAAKKQAVRESKEAEEASIAAEEAKGYETGITYEQLARTPDDYIGQKVKFTGKVIQVIEGSGTVQIRIAVNKDYDTVLYGEYKKSIVSSRVLENDIITIYGTSSGLLSYKSTMGGTITIPSVSIDKIDQ